MHNSTKKRPTHMSLPSMSWSSNLWPFKKESLREREKKAGHTNIKEGWQTSTRTLTSCALSINHGTSDVHGVAVRGSALKNFLHFRKNLLSQIPPAITNQPSTMNFIGKFMIEGWLWLEDFGCDGLVTVRSTRLGGSHGLAFFCMVKESTHKCTSKSTWNLTVSH